MRELFVPRQFKPASLAIIERANAIIADYQRQGFTLTLRQLYYQFVARGLMTNKKANYNKLGSILNDARLAGLVDWDAIEDRTRNVRLMESWPNPAAIVKDASEWFFMDRWKGQQWRPEVWIEKDALVGVIEPVCLRYRVPYFACRGYTSQSEQYTAGKRLAGYREAGFRPVILHLGDHDPSGIDMSRDNHERLSMFAGGKVMLQRLALNMDQIGQYRPPPNFAKETDSRHTKYIQQFNTRSSWELDALDPRVIDRLIAGSLNRMINRPVWDDVLKREKSGKGQLANAAAQWGSIADRMEKSK